MTYARAHQHVCMCSVAKIGERVILPACTPKQNNARDLTHMQTYIHVFCIPRVCGLTREAHCPVSCCLPEGGCRSAWRVPRPRVC